MRPCARRWGERGAEERRSGGAEEQGRGFKVGEVITGGKCVMERRPIRSHKELEVYQKAFAVAMRIFVLTKELPIEERYSLTDQIRRSSRSFNANITEAWRKRRYEGSFAVKLNDAEAEAAETQTWLDFAVECGYLDKVTAHELYQEYDNILGKLVIMIAQPSAWLLPVKR
jgi:four helix bundle protein